MVLKGIVVITLVPLLLVAIAVHQFLKARYVSSLQLGGERVTITRDQHNIPEIHAPSFHSALYAWGYVTAQDRLFQLAFRRASVRGQLSKYLGPKAIDIDKMFRQLNLYGWSVRSAQRFQRQNLTQFNHFKAYAQGINDYYKSITFKPLQFYMVGLKWQDWTVADTFGLYKLIKWSLSFGMVEQYTRSMLLANFTKQQIDRFLPYQPKYWLNGDASMHTTIIKDDEIPQDIMQKSMRTNLKDFKPIAVQKMIQVGFFEYLDVNQRASNSWVISGNHTDSGHAILCNDPHLDSSLPGQWYQIKLFYPNPKGGQYYLIGGASLGMPTIIGKTTYFSVAITTNYVDSQDLFKEKVQNDKYLVNDEWRPLKIRTQKIEVKGEETIEYKVYETHRGPLIKHIGSKGYLYKVEQPLSLCWVGFTDAEHLSLARYVRMAQIDSHEKLLDLLSKYTDYGPHFNLLYSTADDHIGYHGVGLIPLRRHPHMGMYVKDGTNSDNDWLGFIKGADKLHAEDPKRGYIVTANNKAASEKYFSGVLDISIYTGRATRIQAMIEQQIKSGRKISKQFMKSIQLDTVDSYCLWLVEGIKKKVDGDSRYKFVYSLFNHFACNFSVSSTTSCFYLTFLQNLYEQLHPQGFNSTQKLNLANLHHFHQYMYSYLLKQHKQDQLRLLNASLFDGLKQLRTFFKSEISSTFKYGDLHRDHMIHRPFSFVQPIKHLFEYEGPGFGNMNTPNVGVMYRFHDKDYRTNHRANIRLILSYFEDSEWIVDGGISQRFYSKHYNDQTQKFMAGQYLIMDKWNRTHTVI